MYLEAPLTLLGFDGVVAGTGGVGGPSARGGEGGDVIVIGGIGRVDRRRVSLHGGVPGRGGDGVNGFGEVFRPGGDGGAGGSAMQFSSREEARRWGVDAVPLDDIYRDGPRADTAPTVPMEGHAKMVIPPPKAVTRTARQEPLAEMARTDMWMAAVAILEQPEEMVLKAARRRGVMAAKAEMRETAVTPLKEEVSVGRAVTEETE